MGLFQGKKKTPLDEETERVLQFFDDNFREELRERGREYFEKAISDSSAAFKRDLDSVVAQIDTDLKEHITTQLDAAIVRIGVEISDNVSKQFDERLTEHSKTIKSAQDEALQALSASVEMMRRQHQEIVQSLEKNVADLERNVTAQGSALTDMLEKNKSQVATMEEAQASALRWLTSSAQALHDQYQQMSEMLQKNVVNQEAMLVSAFEENMAQVVENYLLGALSEQYDLKAQLPAIIEQMEANKQAIVDDVKL
jgi:hypothetical protein